MPFRIDDVSPASGWRVALSTQFCAYADSQAAALLDDLADGGTGIVQTASVLADKLFHAFGIAEATPITRDVHVAALVSVLWGPVGDRTVSAHLNGTHVNARHAP
ncbi:hypothetical protein OG780_06615 [Streptomyces sp. NBC_00386]|uniref:hypothetical protein n=1 Tax=Streptomyces sp. NBC_00386 TaxID=2975734 RepID=UPI002E24DB52